MPNYHPPRARGDPHSFAAPGHHPASLAILAYFDGKKSLTVPEPSR